MSRPADSALPVAAMMRSRSVDTSKFSGNSGIVTIAPSSFHSGLLVSVGNCTWSEIGCWSRPSRQSAAQTSNIDKSKTYWVQVNPVLLGIVLSTGKFCDTLALGGRNIVSVSVHLISRAYYACSNSSWRRRGWCIE